MVILQESICREIISVDAVSRMLAGASAIVDRDGQGCEEGNANKLLLCPSKTGSASRVLATESIRHQRTIGKKYM